MFNARFSTWLLMPSRAEHMSGRPPWPQPFAFENVFSHIIVE